MSQPEVRTRAELLRVLGLAFGLAVVVGAVVGQGIMRTPGIVAGAIPDKTLILTFWLAGGALVAVSAFALVELATSIPRAGGPYTFAGRAFGPIAGTLVGWIDWLNGIVAIGEPRRLECLRIQATIGLKKQSSDRGHWASK